MFGGLFLGWELQLGSWKPVINGPIQDLNSAANELLFLRGFSDCQLHSDVGTVSKCGDICLSDCDCVASVYGLMKRSHNVGC